MKPSIFTLNETETGQMHQIQLRMLIELDRICRKHNIKYIMDGGTLLGAARHKGFIPWDNDIDVRMLRDDYDRFGKIANEELPSDIFFQSYDTDPGYPWLYGKLRMRGTKAVRVGQDKLQMESGIWIDIFPCDGLPDNKLQKRMHNFIAKLCRKMLYAREAKRIAPKLFSRIGWQLVCIIPRRFVYGVSEHLAKIYSIDNCKKVGIIGWHEIEDVEGFPLTYFEELTELEFEGHQFYAPKEWDGFLRYCFGNDYMKVPPPDKRVVDLEFTEFDTGHYF